MLKIKFDDQDVSIQQSRYEFVTSPMTFSAGKEIQISFVKPINSLYLNIIKQTITKNIDVKFWDGSAWKKTSGMTDMTFGLSQSGFISWERNQKNETNNQDLYTYQITMTELNGDSLSSDVTVQFKGVNLVFSDDWDLIEEHPSIMQHLPEGQETFIRFHASARDEILTDLRGSGQFIEGENQGKKQVDQWDLLDKDEVKEASKFSALSKIFKWLSDTEGDRYDQLAKEYQAEAGASLTPLISIDKDNDGIKDEHEDLDTQVVIIGRL